MADTNFNSSMQLPDANSEVEIEAIGPYEVLNRNVAEAVRSMEKKVKKISLTQSRPFIYRVHKKWCDVNEKVYEPTILAIGPTYHLGKENLKMMEEHKWRYLKELLGRRPDINFENYIAAVAQVEQAARDCYAEPLNHINSPEFIEMLVLDGCFIIELMQKYNATYTVN